jgi:hypothetical protein
MMYLGNILLAVVLTSAPATWDSLAPGLELGRLPTGRSGTVSDSSIVILRVDPSRWILEFRGVSEMKAAGSMTAREWCRREGFTAAINAGMFAADGRTHVGFLRSGDHVNSRRIVSYRSVAAYGPRRDGIPPFRIFDLDAPEAEIGRIAGDYKLVAQNLRLIRRPGVGTWIHQERRWSEAALAEDAAGRMLFLFSRQPFSMDELNRTLLAGDLGIVAAQHLEGGPEAQLFVGAGDVEVELFGSYETSFHEDGGNRAAWPIPNVLGIRQR